MRDTIGLDSCEPSDTPSRTTGAVVRTGVLPEPRCGRPCGSKAAKSLPHRAKTSVSRVPSSTITTQCGRLHPTFGDIDRVQRNMTAILLNFRTGPEETRRARIAGQVAAESGLWSHRTARRVVAWQEHTARCANTHSWPAQLLKYHARDWLRNKIMQHDSLSLQPGRTGTRLQAGKTQTRWHDGAVYARAYVQMATPAGPPESAHRNRMRLEQAVMRERAASMYTCQKASGPSHAV